MIAYARTRMCVRLSVHVCAHMRRRMFVCACARARMPEIRSPV